MKKFQSDPIEMLDVLACDIEVRPKAAPGPMDIAPFVLDRTRSAEAVTITFAPAGLQSVVAFVDAERLCCAGIDWQLQRAPILSLRIGASPAQLDVIEQMFPPS